MPNKFLEQFLDTISANESSRGKDLDHKKIKHGIHKGDNAAGKYGIMPNTAEEMAKRYDLNYTPNPDTTAELLAKHLAKKTRGNPEAMAAGWNQGHNLSKEKLEELANTKIDYVKKYLKNQQPVNELEQFLINLDKQQYNPEK